MAILGGILKIAGDIRPSRTLSPTMWRKEEVDVRLKDCVKTAFVGRSLLSLQRRFRRDHDGRSHGPWNPGTRSCRRRRDPCSVWHPSVCRPKTPCASGLRDKRGNLCADSRRRSLPADRKSSRQTTPCVLAVRRPCPSIVPWSRRKIVLWLFLVGCISHQDHGLDSRSTLLSASFVAPSSLWVNP